MRRYIFAGGTAVITGATSDRGIGMTVAQRYAREGWAVVILDLDGEKSAKVDLWRIRVQVGDRLVPQVLLCLVVGHLAPDRECAGGRGGQDE